MARRVFFTFHYEEDDFKAAIVHNTWATKPDMELAGYIDTVEWEKLKEEGDGAIKDWIDNQMKDASVTAILIGSKTSHREWVKYGVQKSYEQGKGMLAVHVHNLRDSNGNRCKKGDCYFGQIGEDGNGDPVYFWQLYSIYDWKDDQGYKNFEDWVEEAARKARN